MSRSDEYETFYERVKVRDITSRDFGIQLETST